MKVIAIRQNGISTSPRNIVYFKKGEVLQVGDKGLTKENLERLIECGFAKHFIESKSSTKTIYDKINDIPSKKELEIFAKNQYNIELDRRMTLVNMKKELLTQIKD